MNQNECLLNATRRLEAAGIHTARLDALVLLEDVSNKDRGWLLAHPEFELAREQDNIYKTQINRRVLHEPLAYIRGRSEFYGRQFLVTPATLQPRPETETMVDLLKNIIAKDWVGVIADVGTGSGCLAVSAKLQWPKAKVYATEINEDALRVARKNAKRLKADVGFFKGNLLEPLSALLDSGSVLLCNLPYVPDSHTINSSAMQEPKIAIFGGEDGLAVYRELFSQLGRLKVAPGRVLTESLPFQHDELNIVAMAHGYTLTAQEDFIQVFLRR